MLRGGAKHGNWLWFVVL